MSIQNKYLELLKSSLLNEPYLENEVRLLYVFAMLATGKPVDAEIVRQIGRRLPAWVDTVKSARQSGRPCWQVDVPDAAGQIRSVNLRNVCEFSHTMVGRERLNNLHACLDAVRVDNIPGDLIETGVWRGGSCIFMRGYLSAWEMSGRTVWAADSFAGLPVPTMPADQGHDYSAAVAPILAISLDEVKENFRKYELLDEQVRFLEGWFSDTLPGAPIERLAILRLDGDLYESTMDALNALYEKVMPGGFVIVDDYGDFEPCRRAIDEFRATHGIAAPIEKIDWAGSFWRKV